MFNDQRFDQSVRNAQEHLEKLRQGLGDIIAESSLASQDSPPSQTPALAQLGQLAKLCQRAFQELSISLEELHVAQEELHQTNEELVAAHARADAEQRRYQELFELAPDAYLVTDTRGVIREANQAAAALLQVSQRRLVNKSIIVFVHKPDLQTHIDRMALLSQNETASGWEIRLKPRGGQPLPVSITVSAMTESDGQLIGWHWLIRDIRWRQQAEEELHRRDRELSALNAIVSVINASTDLRSVLAAALEQVQALMAVDGVECHLLDASGHLALVAQHGLEAQFVKSSQGRTYPARAGIPGKALGTGRPVYVPNLQSHRHYQRRGAARRAGYRTLLITPITSPQASLGTIGLYSRSPRAFTDEEISLLTTIGAQLAVAIERARLFDELENQRGQLQAFSTQLVHLLEDERQHLSRELHDQSGQTLIGIKLNLDVLARKIPPELAGLRAEVNALQKQVNDAAAQLHAISRGLRPPTLDEIGLESAVRRLGAEFELSSGLPVHFTVEGLDVHLPPQAGIACFRIIQEALTNVARHAEARQVWISLLAHGGHLRCGVRDDGKGFVPSDVPRDRLGLLGMRERATMLGGAMTLESAPGSGTRIEAVIPLGDAGARPARV